MKYLINCSYFWYIYNLLPQRLLNHDNRFVGEVVAEHIKGCVKVVTIHLIRFFCVINA